MTVALSVLAGAFGFLALTFVIVWWVGRRMVRNGQRAFDADAVAADGGKFATADSGRKVEYFTYGSTDEHAPVVVNMHGSGPEAKSECALWAPVCEQLGVRGIAISLPGYGYTDMNPGRVVRDWPAQDLEPVLEQERVGAFMITGHSQGNPHAMAAALHFPQRCVGLGLNAPVLPSDVTKEVGVKGALGMGSLMRTSQLQKTSMAWYFVVYHLGTVTFSPWLPLMAMPGVKNKPALRKIFEDTLRRAVARGSVGGAWESTEDVCFEWKVDPREIETKNICVWHAADDKACPAEIGKWLAEMFAAKEGVRVDYRADDLGLGHVTYCCGEFVQPETSMIKSLLDGLAEKGGRSVPTAARREPTPTTKSAPG